MTSLPPSSSDPADSGPPSTQPQYPAPQPPYDAVQHYPHEQLPYGYTAVGPAAPKSGNGPGLAALIIGIASVVAAFIPLVNVFSFLLGPAGLVVGIVGLVLVDRPRGQAIWGAVLSVVSMGIAFVTFFLYTFGFIAAMFGVIDETTRSAPYTIESSAAPGALLPVNAVSLSTGG